MRTCVRPGLRVYGVQRPSETVRFVELVVPVETRTRSLWPAQTKAEPRMRACVRPGVLIYGIERSRFVVFW